MGIGPDLLDAQMLTIAGKDHLLDLLESLEDGDESQALFADILFCEGCIAGPLMDSELSLVRRRKRDLLDLTEERSRLLTVVNSMADAVLVINSSGDIVLHNPSARQWVLGGNAVSQEEPVPLDRVLEAEPLAALVDEIQADPDLKGRDLEWEVDGARVLHASATRVADEEDRYLGTVVVLRDITGRKEIEHTKSAFVRMVAHELKSPLAAVEGYLDLICQADDAEDRKQMVSRCLGRVQSLQRTIADLLDLSRLERGQVQRELRRCDLEEVLDEVIEMQRVPYSIEPLMCGCGSRDLWLSPLIDGS